MRRRACHCALLVLIVSITPVSLSARDDGDDDTSSQQMYLISCTLAERSESGDVRVVSRPRVLTLDEVPARINVGQQVSVPGTAQLERVQVGVHLSLVPQRVDDERVLLDVAFEVRDAHKATMDELHVTGRSLRSVGVVEVGKTETYVVDRHPNGKTHRWIEIVVVSHRAPAVSGSPGSAGVDASARDVTAEAAENDGTMVLRVYSVAEIMKPAAGRKLDGNKFDDLNGLVASITRNVAPETWKSAGGEGSVAPFEAAMGVVVRQTGRVHDLVSEYLNSLD